MEKPKIEGDVITIPSSDSFLADVDNFLENILLQLKVFIHIRQMPGRQRQIIQIVIKFNLWIAKQLVEKHRGEIGFQSSPAGTTFTVTLPAVK